ncbi:MAG: alpha/beta hydrolase, partial [Atopobiaceae bacterium]|nr:alpha/beta hydrolase [Atopobiaceae bacterium]
RLQEIAAPTLLVHGALDRAVPVEGAILAGEKIPDCEVYLMEGCKHWHQKERPQEFARVLQAYLGRRL